MYSLASSKSEEDDLDSYMESLSNSMHKDKLKKLESKLKELEKERQKITKLLNVAKPALAGLGKRPADSLKYFQFYFFNL